MELKISVGDRSRMGGIEGNKGKKGKNLLGPRRVL